jgi:hypothetical protein
VVFRSVDMSLCALLFRGVSPFVGVSIVRGVCLRRCRLLFLSSFNLNGLSCL